jgi:hypothetical protein
MLICLMSLKNQVVYIQFHPVAYMVKLNIEMSMASLITKLARNSVEDRNNEFMVQSSSNNHTNSTVVRMKSGVHTSATGRMRPSASTEAEGDLGGIRQTKEVDVRIETIAEEYQRSLSDNGIEDGFDKRKRGQGEKSEDELSLAPAVSKFNPDWS